MNASAPNVDSPAVPHWRNYPRFLWNALLDSVEGNWVFYVWMTLLTAIFLVGANAWAVQVRDGMHLIKFWLAIGACQLGSAARSGIGTMAWSSSSVQPKVSRTWTPSGPVRKTALSV